VLEIGIYSGGSLLMWKEYFGENAKIYGVDIHESCRAFEDERTKVFIGDQADRSFWADVKKTAPFIDIVIDDGGHLPEQQLVTLEELLPHVRPGGVYFCEDIHHNFNDFAAYIQGLSDNLNEFNRGTLGIPCALRIVLLQRSRLRLIRSICIRLRQSSRNATRPYMISSVPSTVPNGSRIHSGVNLRQKRAADRQLYVEKRASERAQHGESF